MEKKKILKNEKGFTLIEIIAVLIILGILAAVAVPKFLSLTEEAEQKALEGAVSAGYVNRFSAVWAAGPVQWCRADNRSGGGKGQC